MSIITDTRKLKHRVRRAVTATRKVADRASRSFDLLNSTIAPDAIKTAADSLDNAASTFLTALITYRDSLR